jgi:hypothetical protein
MGLLLSKGTDKVIIDSETGEEITILGKSIFIKGTDIELANVYARMQFTSNPDGRTIVASFKTYLNQDKFIEGKEIDTTIQTLNFDFVILETEVQSLDVALSYSAAKFIDLGYNAEIK